MILGKIFLFIIMLITSNNNDNIITMNCNGEISKININSEEEISCNLLNQDYVFNIKKIENDELYIEINNYGLTTSSSLIEKQNTFIIKRNEEVKLRTQSTDYQEYVTFLWK